MILTIIFLIILALVVSVIWKLNAISEIEAQNRRGELETEREALGAAHNDFVDALVQKHSRVLNRKIRQNERTDEYGKEIGFDKVGEEIDYFVKNVLLRETGYRDIRQKLININLDITLFGHDRSQYNIEALTEEISRNLDKNLIGYVYVAARNFDGHRKPDSQVVNIQAMSGLDFEVYCSDLLNLYGWEVFRIGGTGDQGVDLMATKGQHTVAIQCKRYSRSVGNEAVQQVAAGGQFHEASATAVVSCGKFTASAQSLAARLAVILLHYTELDTLSDRLDQAVE